MRGTVSSCSLAMVVINSRSKRCCSPFRATTYGHSKQSQVMEMPTQNAYHSHEQSLKSWSCCIKLFLRRFIFRHFRSPTWELSREFTNSRCWTFNVRVSSSCAAMFKEPVFSGVENSTRSVDSWFLFPPKAMRDRGQRDNKLQQNDKGRRALRTSSCHCDESTVLLWFIGVYGWGRTTTPSLNAWTDVPMKQEHVTCYLKHSKMHGWKQILTTRSKIREDTEKLQKDSSGKKAQT